MDPGIEERDEYIRDDDVISQKKERYHIEREKEVEKG
jgi:hypothetical protein